MKKLRVFLWRTKFTSKTTTSESVPVAPTVSFILANRANFEAIYPPRPSPDSPLAVIYRIYVATVAGQTLSYRSEIEHFFNHPKWSVANIPEPPPNSDPETLALFASITYILCRAFNRIISTGLPRNAPYIIADHEWDSLRAQPRILETLPAWAEQTAALRSSPLTSGLFRRDS